MKLKIEILTKLIIVSFFLLNYTKIKHCLYKIIFTSRDFYAYFDFISDEKGEINIEYLCLNEPKRIIESEKSSIYSNIINITLDLLTDGLRIDEI